MNFYQSVNNERSFTINPARLGEELTAPVYFRILNLRLATDHTP